MMKDPVFGTVIISPHLLILTRIFAACLWHGHLVCSLARSLLVTECCERWRSQSRGEDSNKTQPERGILRYYDGWQGVDITILVEIACRISPEAMIYSEIYHEWPQAIHGRFHREDPTFEIWRQFRRARGHRATGEIAWESRMEDPLVKISADKEILNVISI